MAMAGMAASRLADRFGHAPINWAAGHNLQHSSQRRDAYLAALRAGDAGDYRPLLAFVGLASADFAASLGLRSTRLPQLRLVLK